MVHRAWSSIVKVPYCFSRSYVKFQCHTAQKIIEFDPNWAFPDSNSSLNSPMAMKCCTKLETAKERCPIVFQGHPSNFKVTRDKTSPILTQVGRFRIIGRSQLSNPSDLPCYPRIALVAPSPGKRHQWSCRDSARLCSPCGEVGTRSVSTVSPMAPLISCHWVLRVSLQKCANLVTVRADWHMRGMLVSSQNIRVVIEFIIDA